MTNSNGRKQAVILSGGGADGAYEVGVVNALFRGESPSTGYRPLNPEIFTGTSVGAYNVAVLVSHLEGGAPAAAAYLENVWTNIIPRDDYSGHNHVFRFRADPFDLLSPRYVAARPLEPPVKLVEDVAFLSQDWFRRTVNFLRSPADLEKRALELVDMSTLFSREPLDRLVRATIRFGSIRDSDRSFRIAATNWKTGDVRIFENEEMTDETGPKAIVASTAIPGVFQWVEIEGDPYVDGGVVMNTPIKPAIDALADTVHIIYLDPEIRALPLLQVQNTLDTLYRMLAIGWADTVDTDCARLRRVNQSIEALEKSAADSRLIDHPDFSARHRKITVHRYHPHDDLSGLLGLLNFERNRMIDLVNRGIHDAKEHDCAESECVLPN
jgi:predicted acylesterase/phospholipase RssA